MTDLDIFIEPDPSYKPKTPDDKAAWEAVTKLGRVKVDAPGAREAIRDSRGMYRIVPTEASAAAAVAPRAIADMSIDELKLMALTLGYKIEKQMKRSDLVAWLEKQVEALPVIDDDE